MFTRSSAVIFATTGFIRSDHKPLARQSGSRTTDAPSSSVSGRQAAVSGRCLRDWRHGTSRTAALRRAAHPGGRCQPGRRRCIPRDRRAARSARARTRAPRQSGCQSVRSPPRAFEREVDVPLDARLGHHADLAHFDPSLRMEPRRNSAEALTSSGVAALAKQIIRFTLPFLGSELFRKPFLKSSICWMV